MKTDGLSGAYDRGELALISLAGQHGHEGEPGKHLLEQLEALAVKFLREIRDPGDVTARTREALDEAQRLGIGSGCHDDGDCGRRVHGGADCDRAAGYDNGRVERAQLGGELAEPRRALSAIAVFEQHVDTRLLPEFAEAVLERLSLDL